MLRRLKRTRNLDVTLEVKTETYLRPPRDAQRNWVLNRALGEFVADLDALDRLVARFVPGQTTGAPEDRTQGAIDDDDIMETWQYPIMRAMADAVTETPGDVLEIGYGRGISAQYIQDRGPRSHTVIECNDSIVESFNEWRASHADRDIRLVHAMWQDALPELETYDGVFFHTYPLNEAEFIEQVVESATFAEHFFPTAASLLRDGGAFTYMTNEIDSLSRPHQRLLLEHFRSFTVSVVRDLNLPHDVKDAWWADSMCVVRAVR